MEERQELMTYLMIWILEAMIARMIVAVCSVFTRAALVEPSHMLSPAVLA